MSNIETPVPQASNTSGGRALNAIWQADLPPPEKLVLMYFGSQLSVAKNEDGSAPDFREWRYLPIMAAAKNTGFCRREIIKILKSLVAKGFLETEKRSIDKQRLPSNYRLTDLLLGAPETGGVVHHVHQGSAPRAPGVVHHVHQGSAPRAPKLPNGAPPEKAPPVKSHHQPRARAYDRNDDDDFLSWEKEINQEPLQEQHRIEQPALRKMHSRGISPQLINEEILNIISEAQNGRFKGRIVHNPTGLLVSRINAAALKFKGADVIPIDS